MFGGPGKSPPNILVIVLDCVRASDFLGGREAVPGLANTGALAKESVHFPRAASVAHWTVPAHASMFTGLYPWQHRVHAKANLQLGTEFGTIGEHLRSAGYRTLSVSANGLISPALGLVRGMDRAAWGSSLFNRLDSGRAPASTHEDGTDPPPQTPEGAMGAARKQLSYWAAVGLARHPFVWDYGTRVAARLLHPQNGFRPLLSHWLEPTLSAWLQREPRDRPVYCFINLLDAHEPYLSDPDLQRTSAEWWEYARTRQDRLGWVTGSWVPSQREFDLLHGLYRGMIRVLDERIGAIVRSFQEAGRWDNTLTILTSDHGQAFGDHGTLFHILGVDEAELRVPLFVRPPGGTSGRPIADGWASLIDVFPTVLEAAGIAPPPLPSQPMDLARLVDAPRPSPVFAMSDGIVHDPDRQQVPPPRRAEIDRILVAAYDGTSKTVADPLANTVRAYDVDVDPGESRDLWGSPTPNVPELGAEALALARRVLAGESGTLESDVEDRLRSWGYL